MVGSPVELFGCCGTGLFVHFLSLRLLLMKKSWNCWTAFVCLSPLLTTKDPVMKKCGTDWWRNMKRSYNAIMCLNKERPELSMVHGVVFSVVLDVKYRQWKNKTEKVFYDILRVSLTQCPGNQTEGLILETSWEESVFWKHKHEGNCWRWLETIGGIIYKILRFLRTQTEDKIFGKNTWLEVGRKITDRSGNPDWAPCRDDRLETSPLGETIESDAVELYSNDKNVSEAARINGRFESYKVWVQVKTESKQV